MNPKRVTRKLRAILSADVQGYSRLMGDDEVATFKTITEYREIFSSIVNQYNGRVVDSPGDNILSEFASVVDAVQCAVEIQKVLKAKNEGLPENRRMIFRIGVNLGDVIHEDDRIYGDGVNIAARIESLADGGGICISGTAYDQIENKLALGYNYFGEHSVKNIAKPIRVYKVPMDPKDVVKKTKPKLAKNAAIAVAIAIILVAAAIVWNSYLRPAPIPTKAISKKTSSTDESTNKPPLPNSDKRSIAVLPFTNMSGDPKEQYLCDGFTEHIITVLAKISDLSVTARNTTFTYKGTPVNIQKLGKELKVKYVLEGSIQKSGNQIRVTAQLIDTKTGNHLWAETYDRNIKHIFDIQDDISLKIMKALQMKLVGGTGMSPCARGTNNVGAYLKFVEAVHGSDMGTVEGLYLEKQMSQEAIDLDPSYGSSYSLLALAFLQEVSFCLSKSPKQSVTKAFELAKKGLTVNNTCPFSRAVMGWVYMYMGQHDKGIEEINAAIAIDPNWADGYVHLANFVHDWNESIELIQKALRLNPLPPPWYFPILGRAYNRLGMYEQAIAAFKRSLQRAPDYYWSHLGLAISYVLLGREEDARLEVSEMLKINPSYSFACVGPVVNSFKDEAIRKRLIEGLKKAGLPYKEASPISEKPSIAVLAFDNMSGNPNQEYFSDGITEQIISSLAKVPRLLVIARNSSFTYKGKPVKVQQVAKELGVRYVLEGSVQKSEDRVRITAQLIDAKTGNHIWSENYDRDIKDIFALQDDITMKIITAVQVELTEGEAARVRARGTENRQAYEKYMQALKRLQNITKEEVHQARKELDEVIALAPGWSSPYAFQSWTHLWDVWRRWSKSPAKSIQKAEELCLKAISLDDENAMAHGVLCHVYLLKKKHDLSIAEGRRAITIAPNYAMGYTYLGTALSFAGESKEAVSVLKTAIRLNPLPDAAPYFQLGFAYRDLGQYDKAIAACKKAIEISPNLLIPHLILTSTYSLAGMETEARAQAKEVLRISPNFSVGSFSKIIPYKKKADKDRAGDALRKAGLPEKPPEKNSEKTSVSVSEGSKKGKVYTHETPGLSIVFPETWSTGEPDPGCLFTAKGGMFGIPKMNVLKERAFASPEDAAKDTIRILEEGKGAQNCRVVYAKKTTLADGTPAFEIMITWDHPMIPGLYTVKTIAQKGDVIIGASITDDKEISEPTIQFLKSLEIE